MGWQLVECQPTGFQTLWQVISGYGISIGATVVDELMAYL